MMRVPTLVIALSFGLCLLYCDSGGNGSDGKSSWLTGCSIDADCAAPYSCHCGVCTTSCAGSDQCQGFPGAAACIEVSSADRGGRCRLGAGAKGGLCVPACRVTADCNAPGVLECAAGVCLPPSSDTTDGGATVNGAGASGATVNGAGASGATVNGGTGAGAGNGSRDASTAGTGALRDASAPPVTASPSDAPPNPYGGPSNINDAVSKFCNGATFTYGGDAPRCLVFGACEPSCTNDTECPSAASGDAVPTCNQQGDSATCSLTCANGERCPTGMICDTEPPTLIAPGTSYPPTCAWVWDSTDKGCPGYCRQDPIPRDCPNWCAAIGVACDPTKGVNCCAGLTCGAQHFCEGK